MKPLTVSVSVILLTVGSGCSTTSAPTLAAAQNGTVSKSGVISEKDFTFTAPSGFPGPRFCMHVTSNSVHRFSYEAY